MSESAQAAITNTTDRGLKNRGLWSPGSGGQKSSITVWAGLAPPEAPVLGVQTLSSTRVLTWSSLCASYPDPLFL